MGGCWAGLAHPTPPYSFLTPAIPNETFYLNQSILKLFIPPLKTDKWDLVVFAFICGLFL